MFILFFERTSANAEQVLSCQKYPTVVILGGVTDSTLCRSARLHVGDDGGSVSIHYKKLNGDQELLLAA